METYNVDGVYFSFIDVPFGATRNNKLRYIFPWWGEHLFSFVFDWKTKLTLKHVRKFFFSFFLPMEEKIVLTPRGFFWVLHGGKYCFSWNYNSGRSWIKYYVESCEEPPLTFEWKLSISRFQNRFVSNYLFLVALLRESNSKVIS